VRTETQTAGEAHLLRIKSEEKAMPTYELIGRERGDAVARTPSC